MARLERKLRVTAGIVLLAIALLIELPGAWEGAFGVLGAAALVTGLVRYCPVKHLLGLHSRASR